MILPLAQFVGLVILLKLKVYKVWDEDGVGVGVFVLVGVFVGVVVGSGVCVTVGVGVGVVGQGFSEVQATQSTVSLYKLINVLLAVPPVVFIPPISQQRLSLPIIIPTVILYGIQALYEMLGKPKQQGSNLLSSGQMTPLAALQVSQSP
jgi:hypothetical protein